MNQRLFLSFPKRVAATVALCAGWLVFAVAPRAQPAAPPKAQPVESGKFRLHKFEQPIGAESYEVTRDGDALVLKAQFEFTDRGTRVPLTTMLRTRQNLMPVRFEIKGKTSRQSDIDTSLEVTPTGASVREGKETRQVTAPARFFAISGYAPVSVQQMMVRYWASQGRPKTLATLPGGEVTIEARGHDAVEVGGKKVELQRYIVSGVIWGREALWFDSSNQLIAAVTVDAEFDHFEAIREGYESSLAFFVTKAAEDGMAALAELARRISPERKGALAIVGAMLVDGTGKEAVNDSAVIIESDRITAVGPRAQVKIPKGATVIDAKGKTLLPGLWDSHAHFEQVEWGPIYLAAGVTTVRDCGNEFEFITAVRDAIKSGTGLGPRLLLAGIVDGDSKMALGIIRANTPDEARAVANRYKNAGCEQIKIYSSVKPDVVAAIADEAHQLGLTVTGHVPTGMTTKQFIAAGADQINHIQYLPQLFVPADAKPQPGQLPTLNFDSPEAQASFQLLKERGIVVDPTMALMELITHPSETPVASFEPGVAKVARELAGPLNNTGAPAATAPRMGAIFTLWLNTVAALHRAGIPIIAGTDQAIPGYSLHRELELYVKAGFAPLEAIQAATIVPARALKLDKEVGTVEVGKRADLILVDGNPLQNISDIRKVKSVISGGRMYDPAQLWQSVGFRP